MVSCRVCSSCAINHHCHGRDGSDPDLCDVCYWRKRAEEALYVNGSQRALIAMHANAVLWLWHDLIKQGEKTDNPVWYKHEAKQAYQDCMNSLKVAGLIVAFDVAGERVLIGDQWATDRLVLEFVPDNKEDLNNE